MALSGASYLLPVDTSAIGDRLLGEGGAIQPVIHAALHEPALEDSEVRSAVRAYIVDMAPVWAPSLGFALLMLVLVTPLYIARCCAHRCCTPREVSACPPRWTYGPKCAVATWVAFGLLSVSLCACALVGVLAAADLYSSIDQVECTVDYVIDLMQNYFTQLSTNADALATSLNATSTAIYARVNGVECSPEAMGSAVVDACRHVTTAWQAMGDIDGYLNAGAEAPPFDSLDKPDAPGDVDVGSGDPGVAANVLYSRLHDAYSALDVACEEAANSTGEVTGVSDALVDGATDLAHQLNRMSVAMRQLGGLADDFYADVHDYGEWVDGRLDRLPSGNWPAGVAVAAFFSPLLLAPLACLCAPMLSRPGSRGHSAAVQCIGVSWALGTFFCFVFLFLGAVLWGVSHSLSDTLGWLYTTPSECASTFAWTFNQTKVCRGVVPTQLSPDLMLSDDLDVAVPQYCLAISHILNGCWSGVDLLSTALGMLAPDIPYSTFANRLTGDCSTCLPRVVAELSNASASLRLTNLSSGASASVEGITATAFGELSFSDAEAINAALAVVREQTSEARSILGQLCPADEAFLNAAIVQVPSLLNLLYRVGECRWVRVAWEDMIAAIEEINEFIVILASAGLLGCGFLYLLYIPSAIGIQVGKGGVGLEPGCPRRCRPNCCGCRDEAASSRDVTGARQRASRSQQGHPSSRFAPGGVREEPGQADPFPTEAGGAGAGYGVVSSQGGKKRRMGGLRRGPAKETEMVTTGAGAFDARFLAV